MAKQTFSVDVPTNADDLITLAKAIIAKDAALGASSPFKNIKNWSAFSGLNGTADTNNKSSNDLYQQAEEATQQRDIALGQTGQLHENTVRWFVTSARDVLLGLFKGSEQQLGEYGFNVTYGPAAGATKSATAAQAKTAPKA
jgi:enamine deaminase RidA (YjgF/YER057c/UK114 family)